jgi:hypothetical protein
MKNTILLLLALTCSSAAIAQGTPQVQTGFIYHFTKYIQWPSTMQSGDFVIGVLGNSDMKSALESLASTKKVGSRAIKVKVFRSSSDVEKCHILFIGKNKEGDMDNLLSKAKSNSTLVVTESSGAATKGSCINFIEASGKVRFELNMATAETNGLQVASNLKSLAILVN